MTESGHKAGQEAQERAIKRARKPRSGQGSTGRVAAWCTGRVAGWCVPRVVYPGCVHRQGSTPGAGGVPRQPLADHGELDTAFGYCVYTAQVVLSAVLARFPQ